MKKQVITACAFVHYQGKMLGVQRSASKKFLPNKWEMIGGHVEFGETCEGALAREIQEEIQCDIIIGKPFYVFTYTRDNETKHAVEIIYLATLKNPKNIQIDETELQRYKWLSENEVIDYYNINDAEFSAIQEGFRIIKTS